jgi:hypothetical protein
MGQHTNDKAAWWTDESGVTHICESPAPLSNELLIWTLCDREVESGAAFVPSADHAVSCSKCAAAEEILERRGTPSDEAILRSSGADASHQHLLTAPRSAS